MERKQEHTIDWSELYTKERTKQKKENKIEYSC
jgi:hypothetical protein